MQTPERDAVMRKHYPSRTTMDAILAMMNALPGETIVKGQLVDYASKLMLRRHPHNVTASRRVYTPERDEVMRKNYPTFTTKADIVGMMNMLPGPRVREYHLDFYAKELGLHRPRDYIRMVAQKAQRVPQPLPDDVILDVEWTTADVVRGWARHNAVLLSGNMVADLNAVNAARTKWGLPTYQLSERDLNICHSTKQAALV